MPFRVPAGIKLIRIDPKSGMRAGPGDQRVILEAFKPGTAPPDNYSVIGVTDADGRPLGVSPEADRGRAHRQRAVLSAARVAWRAEPQFADEPSSQLTMSNSAVFFVPAAWGLRPGLPLSLRPRP